MLSGPDIEYSREIYIQAYNDPQRYPLKVFVKTYSDIDRSDVKVELREGDSVRVLLDEHIWVGWTNRINSTIRQGESVDEKDVRVDSPFSDGDHRLTVWTDNPYRAVRVWVYFASTDV